MDDIIENEVLQSCFTSHSQIASRMATNLWGRLFVFFESLLLFIEIHMLRPEMVGLLIVIGFLTLLINDHCFECLARMVRAVAARITIPGARKVQNIAHALCGDTQPIEWRGRHAHAFAIQGLRSKMEDRFAAEEEISLAAAGAGRTLLKEEPRAGRGLSIYAVYDGHGGDFAAEYTKDHLIEALKTKLQEVHAQRDQAAESVDSPDLASLAVPAEPAEPSGSSTAAGGPAADAAAPEPAEPAPLRSSKSHEAYQRPRSPRPDAGRASAQGDMLVNFFGQINYTKVMQDVFSEVDAALLDAARKEACIAGTTAVLALVDGDQVVVASCGDSRAVLCDARGNAVPLTTDHKPDQLAEKKRITEAGGFVTFNGVWRVNGILATSRALGDLPFKERRLLTCRPDVQTVSVRHQAAPFLLLASDGLWDAVSGQEAVQHVRARLHEPDLGARTLAMMAYQRGSPDNITVLAVDLRPGQVGRSGSFRRQPAS